MDITITIKNWSGELPESILLEINGQYIPAVRTPETNEYKGQVEHDGISS